MKVGELMHWEKKDFIGNSSHTDANDTVNVNEGNTKAAGI